MKTRFLPITVKIFVSLFGVYMMLFGLSGGFDPMHNVLHFVSGIAIIGFLVFRPSSLAMYMMGFGFFYTTIGVVGTVDHETIDRTFLNTPFHPGHIYIGLIGFMLPGVVMFVTKMSLGPGIRGRIKTPRLPYVGRRTK
jgi:hypothetical protein